MINQLELGAIIKSERKQLGYNLDKLAEKIGISRQTLAKWENGQGNGPTVNDLLRMCELFNCDFGYLVGEYSCKRRKTTDIQAETGLSENAINWLHSVNCAQPNLPSTLSFLIEQPIFSFFLLEIEKYLSACRAEVIYDNLHDSFIPKNFDSLDLDTQGHLWGEFSKEIKRIATTHQYDAITSSYLLTYISIFSMEENPSDIPVRILTDDATLEPCDIREFLANKAFSALLKEALENIVSESQ